MSFTYCHLNFHAINLLRPWPFPLNLWELFIHWGRKKNNVCKHVVESYTIYLKVIIQRDCIRLKNIMWACQGVNLLLFMIKVWTDLNTALFSSSFRLTEPKISRFSEIVSGMSKSEKKSCCLKVVWRGQWNNLPLPTRNLESLLIHLNLLSTLKTLKFQPIIMLDVG
jgi:hypothetical protein